MPGMFEGETRDQLTLRLGKMASETVLAKDRIREAIRKLRFLARAIDPQLLPSCDAINDELSAAIKHLDSASDAFFGEIHNARTQD